MSQNVKGNFVSDGSVSIGQISDVLVIPTGVTSMKLTLGGTIDASNTCKTQKSTNNGHTWADQTTYNSAQAAVAVTVVAGEHWRAVSVTQQAQKVLDYEMSAQS